MLQFGGRGTLEVAKQALDGGHLARLWLGAIPIPCYPLMITLSAYCHTWNTSQADKHSQFLCDTSSHCIIASSDVSYLALLDEGGL